jgi:hypothetical protein
MWADFAEIGFVALGNAQADLGEVGPHSCDLDSFRASVDNQGRTSRCKDATMSSRSVYRILAVSAIVLVAVLRLVYLAHFCPLDLAPDEAHYWDWSRHLDWSYYSKGPLVALLIRGSLELFGTLSIALTGGEMLAVRIPAVVCGGLLVGSLYVLTVQTTGSDRAGFFVALTALAFPLVAAGSTLMTIDAPFMALWGWALVTGHVAVTRDRPWAWIATGVLLGLGFLAKYIMVLWLPCLGLYLLVTPSRRGLLLRAGFWRMAALAFLGCVPILWWNSQHDWVGLLHEGGHASHGRIFWFGWLNYLGMQAGVLLGFWFLVWLRAAIRYMPLRSRIDEPMRFLWCMSVPVFACFLAFSFTNGGGEPNWPLAGYLAGGVLAAAWMLEQFATAGTVTKRLLLGGWIACGVLGLVATVIVHEPIWFQPMFETIAGDATPKRMMPLRQVDPTSRLRGWRYLAGEVDKIVAKLREDGIEPVIAGASWTHPGELAFYCEGHPTVYGLGPAFGERHSQYDLWHPNPLADAEYFRGRTFVIVGPDMLVPSQAFEQPLEPVRLIEYREGKNLVSFWTVVIGHDFKGFPKPAGGKGGF